MSINIGQVVIYYFILQSSCGHQEKELEDTKATLDATKNKITQSTKEMEDIDQQVEELRQKRDAVSILTIAC